MLQSIAAARRRTVSAAFLFMSFFPVSNSLIVVYGIPDFFDSLYPVISDFLTLAESKAQFGINLPLLMKEADCVAPEVRIRYYATPIVIRGERYKVCSQWFIRSLGKVRSWIALHSNDDT